jgi:hypothetical protein
MHARWREHVYAAAEQIFQVLAQADEVEQRPILFHVNQEIQVAVRARFPARPGPEDPDVPSPVFLRDAQDVGSPPLKICHNAQSGNRLTYDGAEV